MRDFSVPSPFSRARRVVALVLLVAGWAVPLAFPHLALDDLLCAPVEHRGDGEAPRVEASHAAPSPGHCDVCHALRSFRSLGAEASVASGAVASLRLPLVPSGERPQGPAFDQLPARAPPA